MLGANYIDESKLKKKHSDFYPPIKDRTEDQLLEIVGAPEKWNAKLVQLANNELIARKVNPKKIETAKYLAEKKDKTEKQRKANKGYHLLDFINDPISNLIEILFSWELKKDGYPRKAKQQKYFRLTILILLVILIGYSILK